MCNCGKSCETVTHKLFECDMHLRKRFNMRNKISRIGKSWPISPGDIMNDRRVYIEFLIFINSLK